MNLCKKEKSSSKIIIGKMEEKDNTPRNNNIKKEQSDNILSLCYDKIRHLIGYNIDRLYTSIDNFLFQDIDYSMISFMPIWVADAGISAESGCSKDFYEKMRTSFSHPYLNTILC